MADNPSLKGLASGGESTFSTCVSRLRLHKLLDFRLGAALGLSGRQWAPSLKQPGGTKELGNHI